MAVTWSLESRQVSNDARCDLFDTGYLRIYTAGFAVLLAELRFAGASFGATNGSGVAAAAAITRDNVADAGGTAAVFRAHKADGTTLVCDGNITATGGGGDMTLVSILITQGEPVEMSSFLVTQG